MKVNKSFSKKILSKLDNPEFWLGINPEFTITTHPFAKSAHVLESNDYDVDSYVRQMKQEGYFKLDKLLPVSQTEKMAKALLEVMKAGFPPAFVYVYDEFWQVFRDLEPALTPIFGENYRLVTNLWAWHIPANNDAAGFGPHRDFAGAPLVRPNGLPALGTVWIPLTDLTTANSCMHVLPMNRDPNVPYNLSCQKVPSDRVQFIRALPAKAGSIMSWNVNVLHWGSSSSEWAEGPRISIAAYLKRADEPSYNSISLQPVQSLPLEARLAVIGLTMSHYDKDSITDAHYPPELIKYCEPLIKKFRDPKAAASTAQKSEAPVAKIGRNDPCYCGSGKKYKRCHGQ